MLASFVGLNSLDLNKPILRGTSSNTTDSSLNNKNSISEGLDNKPGESSSAYREKSSLVSNEAATPGKSDSNRDSWSLNSSQTSFLGLDAEGLPTGFTVADSRGRMGELFVGGADTPILTESGLMLSNIVSTRSGAASVLLDQSIIVDSFGTSYVAQVSAGIKGVWHPLTLSFITSEVERLPSGQYLLSAMMAVESALDPAVTLPTGNSNEDLAKAPSMVLARILLNPSKTKILGQAVMVSADSQAGKA